MTKFAGALPAMYSCPIVVVPLVPDGGSAQQIVTAFCPIDAARQSACAAFARYGSRTGLGFSPTPAPFLALVHLYEARFAKVSVQQCIVTLIQRSSASMNADWQSYSQYPSTCLPKLQWQPLSAPSQLPSARPVCV